MSASMKKVTCQKVIYILNMQTCRNMCQSVDVVNKQKKKATLHIPRLPPQEVQKDWIGPPDKISNIRKIKFHIPENEMAVEKEFRETRGSTLEWHHEFWSKHNKNFFTLKDEFVKQKLAEKEKTATADEDVQTITAEEMSQFYKKFLDDNYKMHTEYNKEWYKRNVAMIWPSIKVTFVRMFRRRKTTNTNNT